MTTNPRREAALKLLAATDLRRINYEPPLVKALWWLGFDVPPPHFASFAYGAVFSGVFWGAAWGILMWFIAWREQGTAPLFALGMASFGGLLFGVGMGGYYSVGRRKYKLPTWQELAAANRGA